MSNVSKEVPQDVVLYARVARNDNGQLERQVAHLRECASAFGYSVVTAVTEVSGTEPGQEVVDRLCKADVVVVRDASRLSRRREHSMLVHRRLSMAGVEVVVAHTSSGDLEPIGASQPPGATEPSCSGGALLIALQSMIEEQQRSRHAELTRRGIAAARARRAGQR